MQASVLEALRLKSCMPMASRTSAAAATISGRRVPAGSLMHLAYHTAHLSEQRFARSGRFMPERFIGQDGKLALNGLAAFGYGPRFCPGYGCCKKYKNVPTACPRTLLSGPA